MGTMIAGMIHIRCGYRVRGLRLRRKTSGRTIAITISGMRTWGDISGIELVPSRQRPARPPRAADMGKA